MNILTAIELKILLYVPSGLTFNNSTFSPHSVFICFVWISEQTTIISVYSINWLVFTTEMECDYCAVRNEPIIAIRTDFLLIRITVMFRAVRRWPLIAKGLGSMPDLSMWVLRVLTSGNATGFAPCTYSQYHYTNDPPPPHRNLHAALTSRTNSKAWELSTSKVLPEIGENWIRKYVLSLFFC